MSSRSARLASERPFYDLHAAAYDALITDPVEPWVDAVCRCLPADGQRPASIVDAGCGTGRHAAALMDRGHRLTLVDASPALLSIAARRCPGAPVLLADLCALRLKETFQAVICRGVLNDLVDDVERDNALASFAMLTSIDGVLVIDVRERDASKRRADGVWRTTDVELADGARLSFSSRPSWEAGRIVVEERYEFSDTDGTPAPPRAYTFQMRPWTKSEIDQRLRRAGFAHIEIQPGVGRRTTDRLLVTATK